MVYHTKVRLPTNKIKNCISYMQYKSFITDPNLLLKYYPNVNTGVIHTGYSLSMLYCIYFILKV